jgi:hypothetical protein
MAEKIILITVTSINLIILVAQVTLLGKVIPQISQLIALDKKLQANPELAKALAEAVDVRNDERI